MRVSMRLLLPLLYLHRCCFFFPSVCPSPSHSRAVAPSAAHPLHLPSTHPSSACRQQAVQGLRTARTLFPASDHYCLLFLFPLSTPSYLLPFPCYFFFLHDVSLHTIFYPLYDYKTAYGEKNCFISELNMK